MTTSEAKHIFKPVLLNRLSKYATATSLYFDIHYAQLGIIPRWDWQRFVRLAIFLELTVHELGSLVCVSHASLQRSEQSNRFHGSTALVLTLLEAQAMKDYGGDVISNPIPKSHDPSQGP